MRRTEIIKTIVLIFISSTFLSSCSNKLNEISSNKIATAERFYKLMINGQGDEAFEMLNHGVYDEKWRNIVSGNAKTIEKYTKKHGECDKSNWYIEYDTTNSIYKVQRIVIPIFKGNDKTHSFKALNLKIGFDITNQYLPDTIIADYDLDRIYD